MSGRSDRLLMLDTFDDDRRRGRVVGSTATAGGRRSGVDRFRSMVIDHGALRIVSLRRPGWGNTSLAYEAVDRRDGLAFAAWLLNGHNTAQAEPLGESIGQRFKRWMKGNEVEPWPLHVARWVLHGRKRWTVMRFAHWLSIDRQTRRQSVLYLDENLSVGLTPGMATEPMSTGNSFVMHATGADNGELWVVSDGRVQPVLPGVRNVPLYLLTVLRGDDVVHFGASVDGVRGLPSLPLVRPLAVMPASTAARSYPTIQQAVSSQIGFAADTRVWAALVADVAGWIHDGGAPAVDVDIATAGSVGAGPWSIAGGAGLIRVVLVRHGDARVRFRGSGSDGWWLQWSGESIRLIRRRHERDDVVAEESCPPASSPGEGANVVDLQIADDGRRIGITVDGALVFGRWIDDSRDAVSEEVSVESRAGVVHSIQVFRRALELPAVLQPSVEVPRPSRGLSEVLVDNFDGRAGDLEGTRVGDLTWTKQVGEGRLVLTGEGGVRADATATSPLPGRVLYTVPAPSGGPVEIEIVVVPPGTERGQGERGRAGVVFEQEDGDALIVSTWLDDGYGGASVSSFFRLGGFEDLYDAIWTNVGTGVAWGREYRLRVAFDGSVYEVHLDDELVIYRSLVDIDPAQRPLRIDRVGMVANWEWGTDTGSLFRNWSVRASGGVGRR